MNLQILGEMRFLGLLEVRLPVIVMSSLSEKANSVLVTIVQYYLTMDFDWDSQPLNQNLICYH